MNGGVVTQGEPRQALGRARGEIELALIAAASIGESSGGFVEKGLPVDVGGDLL